VGKFLLLVIVFAGAVYAVFWLIERRRAGASNTPRPSRSEPRPMAPDDDDKFLRDLGRRRGRPDNPRSSDPGPGGPNDGGG
jgi:hypothetical protein